MQRCYQQERFPGRLCLWIGLLCFSGALDEDGRKPSIWDTFLQSSDGPAKDIDCDGYHKYKEDVRLMHDTGLDAFRLSISWPRLIPSGRGSVNPKGLRFYKNLIEELKRHGRLRTRGGSSVFPLDVVLCSCRIPLGRRSFRHVGLLDGLGGEQLPFSFTWPKGDVGVVFTAEFFTSVTNCYGSLFGINEGTGIEPHVTLYHNDLPQALEDEYGGWIDRKIIDDFTAFADVCFREFGNAVKFWSTINEPNMLAWGGYDLGFIPPRHCSPPFGMVNCSRGNSSTEPYIALHNMLLAHTSAARLYKQKYKGRQNGSVGMTCFAFWMVPFTSSEEDKIATQRAKDFHLGWVLHPLVFGDYPDVMKRIVGKRLPSFSEEESELVKHSSDFLGIIHYTTMYIAHVSNSHQEDFNSDMNALQIPFGNSTLVAFDVLPWGLEGVLEYIKQNYGNPPVYILENGQPANHHSSLHDVERVKYLHAYIAAVLNSVRNGSETRGYFQWSFMDLFEFLDYNYTYGLYYVNFSDPERKRSPKTSALWYSAFLKGAQEPKQPSSLGFSYQ